MFELPAPMAGILVKVIKGDGATVVSSEVIATIDTAATVTEIQSSQLRNLPQLHR